MKILVFTEGTAIMHAAAMSKTREQRVQQVVANDPTVANFRTYVPNGNVVAKLTAWKNQGAQLHYLTSRTIPQEVADIKLVLEKYHFPDHRNLHIRLQEQTYAQVAEQIMPDVLIEDDCESIGGEAEMTYPHLSPAGKKQIKSIVVKEFAGIDSLPDDSTRL